MRGANGEQGPQGFQGLKGDKGDKGMKGPIGQSPSEEYIEQLSIEIIQNELKIGIYKF